MNKTPITITVSIVVIGILLLNSASAKIENIQYTGDNLRAINPKIRDNTLNLSMGKWYFNVFITVDDSKKTVYLNLNEINRDPYSSYWKVNSNPTIKISCNNKDYYEIKPFKSVKGKSLSYSFVPNCKQIRVAAFMPYTYGQVLNDVSGWELNQKVEVSYLASPKALNFPIVKINSQEEDKKCVIVTTRQHSTEIYSQFSMTAMVNEILSEPDKGIEYLIFPMANPDGVYYATIHLNALGQDLNDCWDLSSCPEVELMKAEIEKFKFECGRIDYYFDWHGGQLYYTTNTLLYTTERERLLGETIKQYTSYDKVQKYNDTPEKSANYIRTHYNSTVLTLEIQMNNGKQNTIKNLQEDGRNLTRALEEFIIQNE